MSTTGVAPIRVAAIEVSHWHSLYDAAYLRHLTAMPDVRVVGLSDPAPEILDQDDRLEEVGSRPVMAAIS